MLDVIKVWDDMAELYTRNNRNHYRLSNSKVTWWKACFSNRGTIWIGGEKTWRQGVFHQDHTFFFSPWIRKSSTKSGHGPQCHRYMVGLKWRQRNSKNKYITCSLFTSTQQFTFSSIPSVPINLPLSNSCSQWSFNLPSFSQQPRFFPYQWRLFHVFPIL